MSKILLEVEVLFLGHLGAACGHTAAPWPKAATAGPILCARRIGVVLDLLEKRMATHSSILAWRSPWIEETSELQSVSSQRVGHG